MRIIVTGCAGFIGSHLSVKLLKLGHTVLGIDNMNNYYDVDRKKYNVFEVLTKFENFTMMIEDASRTNFYKEWNPDIIYHLASRANVRHSLAFPLEYVEDNIKPMVHILDQIKQSIEMNDEMPRDGFKTKIPKLIYASSSSVYGSNSKVPFCENDTLNNIESPYSLSKKVMEEYANLYNKLYGIQSIGLRFFTVYGPRGRPDMAPEMFLRAIHTGKKITKFGDGSSRRDYTYIDDIVQGLIKSIDAFEEHDITSEVFNLGNSYTTSLNEFIELCEKIVGKEAIIEQLGNQKGDVPITYADISKSRTLLGYEPTTRLEDGMRKTFEWIKEN
jgi:UDP-glucuronate 4-epimerase